MNYSYSINNCISPVLIAFVISVIGLVSFDVSGATMKVVRSAGFTSTLLPSGDLLVVGGTSSNSATTYASAEVRSATTKEWSLISSMSTVRRYHTATALLNGNVLIVGGQTPTLSTTSCEIYNASTKAWSVAGSLSQPRRNHTATLLPDGRVLVTGGSYESGILSSIEIYDPKVDGWTMVGEMSVPRSGHTATLLQNGKILIVGGYDGSSYLKSCDLFDASSGALETYNLSQARAYHTSTAFLDGTVLVVGGSDGATLASCELFNAKTSTWSNAPTLASARRNHAASLMPDGTIIVTGGLSSSNAPVEWISRFNPQTGLWTDSSMSSTRYSHTSTVLASGSLLLVGSSPLGDDYIVTTSSPNLADATSPSMGIPTLTMLPDGTVVAVRGNLAKRYNATNDQWVSLPNLLYSRSDHTATLLLSGEILVVGGRPSGGGELDSCEVYNHKNGVWRLVGSLQQKRVRHATTLLPDGKVLVCGGEYYSGNGWVRLNVCEIYDPLSETWQITGAMASARSYHQLTRLPNGKILATGGVNNYGNQIATCEIYDSATGLWTPAPSMNTARDSHTATLLMDGTVLVAGGQDNTNYAGISGETYDPSLNMWTSSSGAARRRHSATLLSNGDVLFIGGTGELSSGDLVSNAIVSGKGGEVGFVIPSPSSVRPSAIRLLDGRVLIIFSSEAKIFDPGYGFQSDFRPTIKSLHLDGEGYLKIEGEKLCFFQGVSHGKTNDSQSFLPVLRLTSLINEMTLLLPIKKESFVSGTVLHFGPVPDLKIGQFSVSVNSAGFTSLGVIENTFRLPAIEKQPTGSSVFVGEGVALNVVASGEGELRYQWRRNGQSIAGATSAQLVISSASQTDVGKYECLVKNVAGEILTEEVNIAVNKKSQQIIFAHISDKKSTDRVILNGDGGASGNPVTFLVTSGAGMIKNGVLSFTGSGIVTVTASQAGNAYYLDAEDVSQTFTVTKAAAPIILTDLVQVYNGAPRAATTATDPSDLTAIFTYDGSPTPPINAGTYAVVATINDPIYQGSAVGTMEIGKASQAITFAAISDKLTTDSVNLTATGGGSGNPITFAVASGPGVITNNVLNFMTSGSVTVTASQAGNANYLTAPDVSRTFTVTKATAPVTLASLAQTYNGMPRVATATTDPAGLTVEFTYDGSSSAPIAAGTYAVVGAINDPIYQGSTSGTLEIGKASQAITFAAISDKVTTDLVNLTATGGGSNNPVTFVVTSGPGVITNNLLTFTTSGSVTITASQAGNSDYFAAEDVSRTFNVTKAEGPISFSQLIQVADGSPREVSVSTTPAQLTVNLTYAGQASPPFTPGTYEVSATLDDLLYQGTASATLTVLGLSSLDQPILSGSTSTATTNGTNFGNVTLGRVLTRVFTITNQGATPVALSGTPIVQVEGEHAGDFVVSLPPDALVPAAGSVSFELRFAPTQPGIREARVKIASATLANGPIAFALEASGPCQRPAAKPSPSPLPPHFT